MKLAPITVQLQVSESSHLEIDKTQPNLVHYVDRRTKSFYFDAVRTTIDDVPMEEAIVVCGAMWNQIVKSAVERWEQRRTTEKDTSPIRYSYVSITDEHLTDITTGATISHLDELQVVDWGRVEPLSLPSCLILYYKEERVMIVLSIN
jgi:hypothetical protein